MQNRLAFVPLLIILLTSIAAGAYSIQDEEEPLTHDTLSNETVTKQVVRLLDSNSNPVTESDFEGSDWEEFRWTHNRSSSPEDALTSDMEYLSEGYWYASFSANITDSMLEYRLKDDVNTDITEDETLQVGNLTVEIVTDFSGQKDPETEYDLQVNVTDEWNDTFEDQADVDLYVTNGSWVSQMYDLGNVNNPNYHYNNGQTLDLEYDSKYVVHANASYSGASYKNADGSSSVILETKSDLEGKIDYLNSSVGCNNESWVEECELGATLETGFNVTSSSADKVNLTVFSEDRSSGNWDIELFSNMTENSGLYEAEFDIPMVNSSEFEEKVIMQYNASNSNGYETLTRNVTLRSYKADDRSAATTQQGGEYAVKLLFRRYFSLETLRESEMNNGTVDVDYPNGTLLANFTLSEMSYRESSGYFTHNVDIPSDAPTENPYDIEATTFGEYNFKQTLNSGFTVENVTASFNVTDELEPDFNKTGIYERNLTFFNELGSETTVEVGDITGDIESFTEVNNGSDITLEGDGKKEVTVEFNITSVDDYEGEIEFNDTDTNYYETVDVDITSPDCDLRNGTLCLTGTTDSWVNVSGDETGHKTRFVELKYLGEKDTSVSVTGSVSGDVSSYLELDLESFDLEEAKDVTLNYSLTGSGTFTGEVLFETDEDEVSFHSHLDSDVESTDTGINSTDSIDLGYVPEDDSVTREITVENTGEVDVNSLSASSSLYQASIDSVSIPSGESEDVDLVFDGPSSASGSVTLTAESDSSSATHDISVTANPVPDLTEETDSLSDEIDSLMEQTDDEEIETQLQELELSLSDIESDYSQGNYQSAKEEYDSVQSELGSIEGDIGSGAGGGSSPSSSDEGGLPLLPIAAVIIVLLLIGFVAYTSLIPEEGDPLYGLLGG